MSAILRSNDSNALATSLMYTCTILSHNASPKLSHHHHRHKAGNVLRKLARVWLYKWPMIFYIFSGRAKIKQEKWKTPKQEGLDALLSTEDSPCQAVRLLKLLFSNWAQTSSRLVSDNKLRHAWLAKPEHSSVALGTKQNGCCLLFWCGVSKAGPRLPKQPTSQSVSIC